MFLGYEIRRDSIVSVIEDFSSLVTKNEIMSEKNVRKRCQNESFDHLFCHLILNGTSIQPNIQEVVWKPRNESSDAGT
jgi:hypothetical protein